MVRAEKPGRMVCVNRWVVPVACALAQTVTVTPGSVPDPRPGPGVVAGLVAGVAAGLVLRWRHAAPLGVLAASAVAYAAQVLLSVAAVPVAPAVGAFVGAGRRGGPVRGPLAAVGASALTSGALVVAGADDLAPFAVAAVLGAALAGVAVALSAARTAEVRREAVLEERLRIARDLHDVVGHGMGGITVQAGAGRMALDAGADEAGTPALVTIEQAGRGVLREVRWLVGVLREPPERAPLARLPRWRRPRAAPGGGGGDDRRRHRGGACRDRGGRLPDCAGEPDERAAPLRRRPARCASAPRRVTLTCSTTVPPARRRPRVTASAGCVSGRQPVGG